MTRHAAGTGTGYTPCGVALSEVVLEGGIDCRDCLAILNNDGYDSGMETFIRKARAILPFRVFVETATGIRAEYKLTRLAAVRAYKKLSREWPEDAKTVGYETNDSDPFPRLAWGASYVEFSSPRTFPVCVL